MSYPYPFENYRHDILHRLRTRVVRDDKGCLEWVGAKTKQGYGQITLTLGTNKSKTALCHRVLWEFENDVQLGRKVYVCHKCDNPKCLNIDHLYVGTGRSMKGRTVPMEQRQFGVKRKPHTRERKLCADTIRSIRAEPEFMKIGQIAGKYNISSGYVSKLRNGKAKALVK